MENLPRLIGKASMQSHLDELVAAVEVLAAQEPVDASRIVGLGNSEGALHVLHYATSVQDVPLVGLVLAAPPGRPIQDVLLSQLALQAAQCAGWSGADAESRGGRCALRGRAADEPRSDCQERQDGAGQFRSAGEPPAGPRTLGRVRGRLAPRVRIPALVLIGGRDVQIDVHADGDPLRHAAAGMANLTFAFPPSANHVFKEDARTPAEVAASPGDGYNAPDTRLDPESLSTILTWLQTIVGPA